MQHKKSKGESLMKKHTMLTAVISWLLVFSLVFSLGLGAYAYDPVVNPTELTVEAEEDAEESSAAPEGSDEEQDEELDEELYTELDEEVSEELADVMEELAAIIEGLAADGAIVGEPDCTLRASMEYLVNECGQRFRKTPNEEKAAEFVYNRFKELGYDNAEWTDDIQTGSASNVGRIVFKNGPDILGNANPNNATFPKIEGAKIVRLGLNGALEIPDGLSGDVIGALRFEGTAGTVSVASVAAAFNEKYPDTATNLVGLLTARVGLHGITNITGTANVPVISLSEYFFNRVLLRQADFDFVERYTGTNTHLVTAVKPATFNPDDPELIIILTAHIDTVINTPGAEDDASGVAALIELARRFKEFDTGGIELRFAAVGAEESAGFFANRAAVSAVHADLIVAEGVAPISINLNMDMISPLIRTNDGYFSGTPNDGRGFLDAISMDVAQTPLGTMSYGQASNPNPPLNLPAYLVTDVAKEVINFSEAPAGIENVRLFNSPYGDHVAYHARGMDAAMMIVVRDFDNDASGAYHLPIDDIENNYCYETHLVTTGLMEAAVLKAIDQEVSKRAKFIVDERGGKISLQNADALFKTFHTIEVTVGGALISFEKGAATTLDIPADAADFAITDVTARGTGTADNKNAERNERL